VQPSFTMAAAWAPVMILLIALRSFVWIR